MPAMAMLSSCVRLTAHHIHACMHLMSAYSVVITSCGYTVYLRGFVPHMHR